MPLTRLVFRTARPGSATRDELAARNVLHEVNVQRRKGLLASKSYVVLALTILLFAVMANIAVAGFVKQERTVYLRVFRRRRRAASCA